jgi:acetyl esterase/lipase
VSGALLLVFALLGVLHVGVALFGPRRPARIAYFIFLGGLVTSELAWFNIIWAGLVACGLIALGALETTAGVLGLGLLVLVWICLLFAQVRQSRSRRVLAQALDAGIGRAGAGARRSRVDPIALLRPWRPPERGVTRIDGLRYGDDPRQYLEVLRPSGLTPSGATATAAKLPVLLHLHGGSWAGGRPERQSRPLRWHFAARGWLTVAPGYRVSPAATFPDQLLDAKRALAWVREHAEELGVDPGLVVVSGGSAGGHLASMLALTANDPAYQPGFEDDDTSVAGCIAMYGVFDFLDRNHDHPKSTRPGFLANVVMKSDRDVEHAAWDAASPIAQVRPDAPPFFVIHGDFDSLVWREEADSFVRALAATSEAPVSYAILPGAQHAFDALVTVRSQHVVHAVHRFAEWLRVEAQSGAVATRG